MKLTNSVYSIDEAAVLLQCELQNLIFRGVAGEFELLVPVPRDLDVYNGGYNEIVMRRLYANEGAKPKPFRQSDLEFFVLPDEALQLLASSHAFMQAVFHRAAKLSQTSGEIEILKAEPPVGWNGMLLAHKSPDVFSRCFATYRPGTDLEVSDNIKHPQKFEIKVSDLLIARTTIELLQTQAVQHKAVGGIKEMSLETESIDGTRAMLGFPHLVLQEYTSADLKILHKLFTKVWQKFGLIGFSLPKRNEVEEILIRDFAFSKNRAQFGAKVITDNVGTDADNKTGAPRMVPELMNALIAGSVEHWSPKPTKPSPSPSNAEVADWFVRQYSLPRGQAEIAAMVIRAPNARKGRRPEE